MKLYDIPRTGLVFGASDTSKSFTIVGSPYRGVAITTQIEIPNWTEEVTLEYRISDPRGKMLYHATNLARDQTSPPAILTDPYPVFEGCVVTLTLSDVPGETEETAYVAIYYGGTRYRFRKTDGRGGISGDQRNKAGKRKGGWIEVCQQNYLMD